MRTPAARVGLTVLIACSASCTSRPDSTQGPAKAPVTAGAPAGRTESCWTVTPPSGATADAAVTRWIEVLKSEKNAANDKKAHRDAAAGLGKRGSAAWNAVTPLYLSLSGENAFEAALDGTYADVVTTAIAAISQERAVPQSLAILSVSQGTQLQADRVIWGTVIRKVGAKTVPCVCEIVVSNEKPELVSFYTMMLQSLAERNALQDAKGMALASVQKLQNHADERVRQTGAEALAAIQKAR